MEYQKTGKKGVSALRSGMTRKTARKYLKTGKLPSANKVSHTWLTRKDPFASSHWEEVKNMLQDAPDLEAKALFEWLCERYPSSYHWGQLRTFQRHVRSWRALEGPDKEIYFPQDHIPGRIMQTDFTHMNSLKITICKEPFKHLLCHSVLTYSNWEWGVICHSESMIALKKGIQSSLLRLGRTPLEHWTDHSTAATHVIGSGKSGGWEFNDRYLELMKHYKLRPRTINVDAPHEQGDVESLNGAFKRRVNQHLILRGSRDFGSEEEYRRFLENIMDKGNRSKQKRLDEELSAMRLLTSYPLPEFYEEWPVVTNWSTISVGKIPYSVPGRLIGKKVLAKRFEDHIEIYYHNVFQLSMSRVNGEGKHAINYRHVIGWLIRKPGAFRHYRYREDLFPSAVFRRAYDSLCSACSERVADLEYLRILHYAARNMESRVELALKKIEALGIVPRWNTVLEFIPGEAIERPYLSPLRVDLGAYDSLLYKGREVLA